MIPSFFAPGNLPALNEECELKIVILSDTVSIKFMKNLNKLNTYLKGYDVEFIAMDDLVTGKVYGVTLTKAYFRAVTNRGADSLNINFMFMNSDFVLGEGSLKSALPHLDAGRSVIVAPSFRASAEAVEPTLLNAVDPKTGILSIPRRRLADLALRNLHPTTAAKFQDQSLFHTTHPNQMYWWVDKNTVVGLCPLVFMLCIRPERQVLEMPSYCDYGFIPEFCPSGNWGVLDDSDDFFMLETQAEQQEFDLLRPGPSDPKQIAENLASWTTAEHRRLALIPLVFHSEDVPPTLEAAKADAIQKVSKILDRLPPPLSHVDHYHWVYGERYWCLPAVRGYRAPGSIPRFADLMRVGLNAIFGAPPLAGVAHPLKADFDAFRRVAGIDETGGIEEGRVFLFSPGRPEIEFEVLHGSASRSVVPYLLPPSSTRTKALRNAERPRHRWRLSSPTTRSEAETDLGARVVDVPVHAEVVKQKNIGNDLTIAAIISEAQIATVLENCINLYPILGKNDRLVLMITKGYTEGCSVSLEFRLEWMLKRLRDNDIPFSLDAVRGYAHTRLKLAGRLNAARQRFARRIGCGTLWSLAVRVPTVFAVGLALNLLTRTRSSSKGGCSSYLLTIRGEGARSEH